MYLEIFTANSLSSLRGPMGKSKIWFDEIKLDSYNSAFKITGNSLNGTKSHKLFWLVVVFCWLLCGFCT